MKRTGIFLFFDADGEVSDFIPEYLSELKKNLSSLIIVVNGHIGDKGLAALQKITDRIFIRENKGFDAWAFKETFDHYGYDYFLAHDELVLCNCTCYGPFYPFNKLFDKMDEKPCDFWGITAHPTQKNSKLCERQVSPHIDEHIQTYFVTIRRRMLHSPHFRKFWETIPEISTFFEAVSLYEIVFTKHFRELGFSWDVLVNPRHYEHVANISMNRALEIIRDDENPFLKRKIFSMGSETGLTWGQTSQPRNCMAYLRHHNLYDTNLIIRDMLRTQSLDKLRKSFHWNFIVPGSLTNHSSSGGKSVKIGVILHLSQTRYIGTTTGYLASLPENASCVLIPETEEIDNILKNKEWAANISLLPFDNGDSSLDRLIKTFRTLETGTELICHASDYTPSLIAGEVIADEFLEFSYSNGLRDRESVESILSLFAEHNLLGCLQTPNLIAKTLQGSFSSHMPRFEYGNMKQTVEALEIERFCKNEPLEYTNDVTWARAEIFEPFINKLEHASFSNRPGFEAVRAMVSLLPYVAQKQGRFTASVIHRESAECLLDDIREEARSCIAELAANHSQSSLPAPAARRSSPCVKIISCLIPIAKYRRKFRKRFMPG